MHCNSIPISKKKKLIYINKQVLFFLNGKFWITDRPLEYHRATSKATRSYPSPLGYNAYTPVQEETQ
ncbi:hypothetical protein Hanom_Chr03g00240521 [Helianthus anomalus]